MRALRSALLVLVHICINLFSPTHFAAALALEKDPKDRVRREAMQAQHEALLLDSNNPLFTYFYSL